MSILNQSATPRGISGHCTAQMVILGGLNLKVNHRAHSTFYKGLMFALLSWPQSKSDILTQKPANPTPFEPDGKSLIIFSWKGNSH